MPDGRLLSPHDPLLSIVIAPAYEWFGRARRPALPRRAVGRGHGRRRGRRPALPARRRGPRCSAPSSSAPAPPASSTPPRSTPRAPPPCASPSALLLVSPLRLEEIGSRNPGAISSGVALAVVLTALAWFGVKYVPVGAVLALAWAWRHREDRRALGVTAVLLALSGAAYVWWHLHTFDGLTPYATNVVYSGEGSASIIASHVGRQRALATASTGCSSTPASACCAGSRPRPSPSGGSAVARSCPLRCSRSASSWARSCRSR